jgi:multiple sugar transport system permease protein
MNWTKALPAAREVDLTALWQRLRRSDIPAAILFLFPALVILSVFNFYPIAAVLRLSLYKWDNLGPVKTFIGLANYQALLRSDRFWNSIVVTLEYTVAVTALSIAAGLVLAVLLNNRRLVLRSFWRSLYFLPSVTPTVAAAMVWMLIFNPSFGYANVLLRLLGIQGPNWLADQAWALPTLMLLGVWRRLGFNFIIYLAALQAIPSDYYESAEVDGANAWQRFLRITVPLVNPTTVMLVILGVIDSFLVFDQVMVLTRGGPANATEVIGFWMYLNAFSFFKMGYGAAISVVMFLVIAAFTVLQWRFVGFGRGEIENV